MIGDLQLDEGEKIVLSSHRHWINFLPVIVVGGVLLAAGIVFSYLAGREPNLSGIVIKASVDGAIAGALVILAALILITGYWVFRRNMLILTNHHLIKIEQDGIFARKTSQLSLGRVQDVDGVRKGVVATLLDYGNLEIETAGEQENFKFIQMPHPSKLAQALTQAHDQFSSASLDGTESTVTPAPVPPVAPAPSGDTMPLPASPEPTAAPVVEARTPLAVPPVPDLSPDLEPETEAPAPPAERPVGPQPLVENQAAPVDPPKPN